MMTAFFTASLLLLFPQAAASSLIGDSTQGLGNISGGLPVSALTGAASEATGGLLGNLTGGAGGLLGGATGGGGGLLGGVTGGGGGLLSGLTGGGLLGGLAGGLLGGQGGGNGGAGNILNISVGSPILGTLLVLVSYCSALRKSSAITPDFQLTAILQLLEILLPLAATLL
ncbi:hypothetical protein Aduo_007647 [Ancylostoma duodenale]